MKTKPTPKNTPATTQNKALNAKPKPRKPASFKPGAELAGSVK